jgi:hypothetical protein
MALRCTTWLGPAVLLASRYSHEHCLVHALCCCWLLHCCLDTALR